jgi:hypothetical protein
MPTYVIGDPQAPFAKVLEVLDRHGVLAPGKDRIADGVTLVSIGDHFDYNFEAPAEAAREGLATLRWLASHDPAQAVLLFGNHDAARVMELALLDDETFQVARALGREIDHVAKTVGPKAGKDREREFFATYPTLPSSGVIGRDYASFTTEQRALVIDLLLAGRFSLARTCVLDDGRAALLTHAGVTQRELAMLGIEFASEPSLIATTLEQFFADAIDRVRPAWTKGELAALSLAPLHVTGSDGEEGGASSITARPTPRHRRSTFAGPRVASVRAASIRASYRPASRRSSGIRDTQSACTSSRRGPPRRRARASVAAFARCA